MGSGISYRTKKSIRNWREYNAGLKRRYDVTVWLDDAVLAPPARSGKKGRPKEYSDALIELGCTLKALYRLPWRGLQGFMESLPGLSGNTARVPDHTTFNRRSAALGVALSLLKKNHPIHLVVDTTGLKVCGEGEWKVRKHGWSQRRTWRKLHLGVDDRTQEIVVADLTGNSTGDQEHLPELLENVPEEIRIRQVTGDGIYDTYGCYDAARAHGARLVTPPRGNAVLPVPDREKPDRPLDHPRHKTIRDCRKKGRKRWKKEAGYHRRSLAETAMYRFKITFGDKLAARSFPHQKTEALIKAKTLNTLRQIAAPRYA